MTGYCSQIQKFFSRIKMLEDCDFKESHREISSKPISVASNQNTRLTVLSSLGTAITVFCFLITRFTYTAHEKEAASRKFSKEKLFSKKSRMAKPLFSQNVTGCRSATSLLKYSIMQMHAVPIIYNQMILALISLTLNMTLYARWSP